MKTNISMPLLQVDWGITPRPGTHLSPKFTILGLNEDSQPALHFPLDERIRSDNWNPHPVLERNGEGWSFHQPLRLDEPGQYLLRLLLIDRVPGEVRPTCYQAEFRVTVLPEDRNAARTLEISADGLLTANLHKMDTFDHVKINAGTNVLLNAPEESLLTQAMQGRAQNAESKPGTSEQDRLVVSVAFVQNEEYTQWLPHPASLHGDTVSRIRLLIPNQPLLQIQGGSEFTFGRDIPEEKRISDIPLKIEAFEPEHSDKQEIFELISRLFSREHAHLKWDVDGVWLFDDRTSGPDEGTIVNGKPLARKQGILLFPHHEKRHNPVTVLFAKMLEMKMTPFCETLFPERLIPFPEELQMLYGFDDTAEDTVSSVRLKRQKHLRQYQHVDSLKASLKKTALADSPQLNAWLQNRRFPDPLSDHEEYLFVHTFATLGGHRGDVVAIPHQSWRGVQLRILNLGNVLHLQNSQAASLGVTVTDKQDVEQSLGPFRRVPIRPGMKLRVEDSELTFL